ncbi:MAG: TetR/AcrR family transcriptional regulator [Solirubrobacterales bacterium]
MSRGVKVKSGMAVPTRRYTPRLPRSERREQILDATLHLIAENGFGGVSMEAVAREVGVAKTVVYDAFANKEKLLNALFAREQQRTLAEIAAVIPTPPLEGEPAEILATSVERLLKAVAEHPDAWRLILMPADGMPSVVRDEVNRHREGLVDQIQPMIAWGMERLGIGSLDSELAAAGILGAAENAARLSLTDPKRFPPQRIAEFAADVVTTIRRAGPDD